MTTTTEIRVHPVADLFPMASSAQLDALARSISERGLAEPIVLDGGGVLLDGRNRLEACRRAGVEPTWRTWEPRHEGDTPEQWIIDMNAARREMTTSQRACVAAGLVETVYREQARERQREGVRLEPGEGGKAAEQAGRRLGVGRATVESAMRLRRESPELFAEVLAGGRRVEAAVRTLREQANAERPEHEREAAADRSAAMALARAVTSLLSAAREARVHGEDGWVDEARLRRLVGMALDEMGDEEGLAWSGRPQQGIRLLGAIEAIAREEFVEDAER